MEIIIMSMARWTKKFAAPCKLGFISVRAPAALLKDLVFLHVMNASKSEPYSAQNKTL